MDELTKMRKKRRGYGILWVSMVYFAGGYGT